MTRRLLILGACIAVALAVAASPALADGQSTTGSLVTVQVGTVDAGPSTAAAAPVNADAPVCLLASCAASGATQSSGGSAATGQSSGRDHVSGSQSTRGSIGTAQVESVGLHPATAVVAPVNANAPVCVISACRGGGAPQAAGGSTASSSTGGSGSVRQATRKSVGTVQIGAVDIRPATAVAAPVTANAPVCVLASCPHSEAAGGNSTHAATSSAPATASSLVGSNAVPVGAAAAGRPAHVSTIPLGSDGGHLGTEAARPRHDAPPLSGVLAAMTKVKALPFTGLGLPAFLLAALMMLAIGGATRVRTAG